MRSRLLALLLGFASLFMAASVLAPPVLAQGLPSGPGRCSGSFVNPVTDVCWGCMFPLSLGSLKIWPSSRADTDNPDLPICACGTPVPRIGLAIGFWEPVRLIDVSTKPWCFPNLGGIKLDPGFPIGNGYASDGAQLGGQSQRTAKYHVHYYIYPLLYWLEVVTDFLCLEASSFDVAYMSEIDPLWQDDELASLLNPEAALFTSVIAQAACSADCISASARLPMDELFWCSGCQGSMYPMNGNIGANMAIQPFTQVLATFKEELFGFQGALVGVEVDEFMNTDGFTFYSALAEPEQLMAVGERTYIAHCAACHQPNGEGLSGIFPALKGSAMALNDKAGHIGIVLNGKAGTAMQAYAKQLSLKEIAAVITYERNAWGNNTGELVQAADVHAVMQGKGE